MGTQRLVQGSEIAVEGHHVVYREGGGGDRRLVVVVDERAQVVRWAVVEIHLGLHPGWGNGTGNRRNQGAKNFRKLSACWRKVCLL